MAVLLLRCLRTSTYVLVAVGAIIAWTSGDFDEIRRLATPVGLLASLLTPLFVLAIGVGLRILLGPAAWVLALVVVLEREPESGPAPKSTGLGWTDVARAASALSALRWSVYVRRHAVQVLGPIGLGLWVTELLLRVVAGLGFLVLVVVVWP